MADTAIARTIVSSKGQIVLPKAIRDRKCWESGTRLEIEDRPDGVLIRKQAHAPRKKLTIDDLIGCLQSDGPPVSDNVLNRRIGEELKRDDDRIRHEYSRQTGSER